MYIYYTSSMGCARSAGMKTYLKRSSGDGACTSVTIASSACQPRAQRDCFLENKIDL